MANLLFFLALMLFPLFFLTQTVTLRFQYYKEPVISIDFILFALFFFPERKRRKRRRKKRNIKKAFKFLSASLRPLEYFLKGSEFEVRNFEIFNNGENVSEFVLDQEKRTKELCVKAPGNEFSIQFHSTSSCGIVVVANPLLKR